MALEVIPEVLVSKSPLNRISEDDSYFPMASAIVHIVLDNDRHGSGFFFKIDNDVGLFTNNHVLNKWTDFTLINQVKGINQAVHSSDIKWIFTDPDLDVSFFVLHTDLDDSDYFEKWEDIGGGVITILQYPYLTYDLRLAIGDSTLPIQISVQDFPLYWASGDFTKVWGHLILHEVSTASMSSGAAMLQPNTTTVIGIHRGMTKITKTTTMNIGIRIRDIIECIRWETRKRELYSPNIPREIERMPHKSPQTSVFEMKFTSGSGVFISTGLLCSIEDKGTHLKGVLTTFAQTDVRRGFHMHFYGVNIDLDVQSEDICLVFTDPKLNFTFMALTEHFISTTILALKLNFLSAAEPTLDSNVKIQHFDTADHGIVNVINGNSLFIKSELSASIGTPVLNDKNQVIGIVKQNLQGNRKAANLRQIRKFIFKQRVFDDQDMEIPSPQIVENMENQMSVDEKISDLVYLIAYIKASCFFMLRLHDEPDFFSSAVLAFWNTNDPMIAINSILRNAKVFSVENVVRKSMNSKVLGEKEQGGQGLFELLLCGLLLAELLVAELVLCVLLLCVLLLCELLLCGLLLCGLLLCEQLLYGQLHCGQVLYVLLLYRLLLRGQLLYGLRLYIQLLCGLLVYGLLLYGLLLYLRIHDMLEKYLFKLK